MQERLQTLLQKLQELHDVTSAVVGEVAEILVKYLVLFDQFLILPFQLVSIIVPTMVVFVLNRGHRNLLFLMRTVTPTV